MGFGFKKIRSSSLTDVQKSAKSKDLGPVHTYPDIFESATFSLR